MNRVLERQIKRYLGDAKRESLPEDWKNLLQAVSDTYDHADDDRTLLLHSLDLSSQEFAEINKKLQSQNEIVEEKVQQRTQELDYERVKLNTIAQHMDTGAILLDKDGKVSFVNIAATRFLHIVSDTQALDKLTNHFPDFPIADYVYRVMQGESTNIPEAEAHGKIYAVSFTSLKDESSTAGALIWLQDITAQKMLERSKNQFLEIAAHEMRTPLSIIRGNAELMLEDDQVKNNEELTYDSKSILRNAVRLLSIANDFLDVQRLEEGKLALDNKPVDIFQTLRDTVRDMLPLAQEKNLSLTFNEPLFSLPPLMLDVARLQQIYVNLMSNAIHYTASGGITIAAEQNSDLVKLTFTDTGSGISPEEQTQLFKKFIAGKQFMHNKEYGSGLGLYISKLLADLMGIDVRLERSEEGKGSVFSLTFPLATLKQS
ncbi:PAS domain-containing sensor histidine kinase [Patescibacteria group bacterium]|nr:PAS domain-containing sensor histidine kinase [Patescibacteria group bacterium]